MRITGESGEHKWRIEYKEGKLVRFDLDGNSLTDVVSSFHVSADRNGVYLTVALNARLESVELWEAEG